MTSSKWKSGMDENAILLLGIPSAM
jgi:hypothetical protein